MVTINRCNTEMMVYFIRLLRHGRYFYSQCSWSIASFNRHNQVRNIMFTVGKPKLYLESRFHRNSDAFNDLMLKYVCHVSKESMLVLFFYVEPMQILSKFPEQYSFFSLHVFFLSVKW